MKVYTQKNLFKFFIYSLLIFTFFEIPYLTNCFSVTNKIYLLFQMEMGFLILFLVIYNRKYSKIINYIFFFAIITVFSTYINSGEIKNAIYSMYKLIMISLLFDIGINRDRKIFLSALCNFFNMLVIINFFTILFFPKGMYIDSAGYYQNWLLGYKNLHILYMLPSLLFNFLNSYIRKNCLLLKDYILLFLCFGSLILVGSSTSLVGILLLLIYLILPSFFKKMSMLNIKNYFVINTILFLSIIIFRIQEIFSLIIVKIFKKNITFTGRTFVWDYVLEFIKEKPFLGYGIENSGLRFNKTNTWRTYHAHNQILEIIYKSGIIGLLVFGLIVYFACKELYKENNEKISKIISFFIFIYFIMMLTEFYNYNLIVYIFILAFNVKCLIKK